MGASTGEWILGGVAPDMVRPEQYFHGSKALPLGMRRMFIAAVERAVADLSSRKRGVRRDAWRWVFGHGDYALPFEAVCEALGLDVAAVRRKLWRGARPTATRHVVVLRHTVGARRCRA